MYQAERIVQYPEVGEKVAQVILQLTLMSKGIDNLLPFDIVLDDPAGNSFVENPFAPLNDPFLKVKLCNYKFTLYLLQTSYYIRSPEQDVSLGLQPNKGNFKDDSESHFTDLISKPFGSADQGKISKYNAVDIFIMTGFE
jgi:hypothetical protein